MYSASNEANEDVNWLQHTTNNSFLHENYAECVHVVILVGALENREQAETNTIVRSDSSRSLTSEPARRRSACRRSTFWLEQQFFSRARRFPQQPLIGIASRRSSHTSTRHFFFLLLHQQSSFMMVFQLFFFTCRWWKCKVIVCKLLGIPKLWGSNYESCAVAVWH